MSAPESTEAEYLLHETYISPPADEIERQSQPFPNPEDLVGQRLDVYVIRAFLGKGAMGQVFLADHVDLNRPVALKILAPRIVSENGDYVKRFKNEGRAAASVVHPHIVTVHAIGESEGFHFLEMEFLPGQSLSQLIHLEKKLDPIKATRMAFQVAEGLAMAHSKNLIHQDLKPDNVLLNHLGVPKIADFGLAKRLCGADGLPEGLMGTPHFMAPELFQGHPPGKVTDVYALGVTYYLMLTGQYPFRGNTLREVMQSVLNDSVPDVRKLNPQIPLEMAECVHQLMAFSPSQRPQDGIAAAQLLSAILGELQDVDWLLRQAFHKDPSISCFNDGIRHRVELSLESGRKQSVFVECSQYTPGHKLLLIYSVCCPADPTYYEYALRLNSEIPHGGLAIRNIHGKDHFVMVESYPRSTVDVEEIQRSVYEVGQRADDLEKLLTGHDHN